MAAKDHVLAWLDTVEINRGPWPAALLLGMIDRLSDGDPELVNRFGARGLFQIHPDTARAIGIVNADQLYDPDTATIAAVALLDKRQGEIRSALSQACPHLWSFRASRPWPDRDAETYGEHVGDSAPADAAARP